MRVSGLDTRVSSLETSFPAGCNTIMQAVTAKGQTPASNSPYDIATAIGNISISPDIDLSLLNKSNYTESEFLNSVCKKDWFDCSNGTDSGASLFIKKTVTISNSLQDGDKSMDWIIIDYNHDNSYYTFDLWASRAMFDNRRFSNYSNIYEDSNCIARTRIENAISGFSNELQARLQIMRVSTNSTISSKIKILSLTEMGITGGEGHPGVEGNVYDKYFATGRSIGNTYKDLVRNGSSGYANGYWTRSRYSGGNYISVVTGDGYVSYDSYSNYYNLIPVIRISVD